MIVARRAVLFGAALVVLGWASEARASPLGGLNPPSESLPPVRTYEVPTCDLHELLGARMIAITNCGTVKRCIFGPCETPAERAGWPTVCLDQPVVQIVHETIGGRRQWAWYPLLDVSELEIAETLHWGQSVEGEIQRALAADSSSAQTLELLALLDAGFREPSFSRCLGDWTRGHVLGLAVSLAFDGAEDDAAESWAALREWFGAADSEAWREPLYDLLHARWRREPENHRAEFDALTRQVLDQRTAVWVEQRERGYEATPQALTQRLARDRWLLGVALDVAADRQQRREIDAVGLELCGHWAAASDVWAVTINVDCDADPPTSTSRCNLAGGSTSATWLMILLWWLNSDRRRRGSSRPSCTWRTRRTSTCRAAGSPLAPERRT
jgi:hypothetical protein